jgi:hypothetical protein
MYPWESTKTFITDADIQVWARPVPPYAEVDVDLALPAPPIPKVTIKSVAGHEETARVLPETQEWEDFQAARRAWDSNRKQALMNFQTDYGVVQWRYPNSEEIHTQPPESWVAADVLARWNVWIEPGGRRVAFIKYCLIQTQSDQQKLEKITLPESALSTKEILAAMVPSESPEMDKK